MITATTIDRIFEASRVEEVIGEFVQLKRAGTNLKGLSPFADEKSPSFMVSPVKQIWKDFSSGKGGNAVSFLMEHEHYTSPEALRWLAKKYNIEIEETQLDEEQKQSVDERESMYVVSNYAKDYFHQNLFENEEGKSIGLTYFKERGFREETIKKFQLGFSLNQWDAFTNQALSKGYDLKYLEKTGLTIVKENRNIDRFKGRVMFPIHSMSGRVLGFGGRILDSTEKAAKYLNSPASEIYDKSKVLYGIFYAKQAIAKENNCYLVEGYTDVITLHQSGIENVVSSSGTALTPDQIRLIKRLTPNITVLYDGDAAGIRASFRGIDLILEQDLNVKVLTFPNQDDPDSYARKVSSEELKEYLTHNATDFIKFKISILMEEAENDPIKKAELVKDIIKSISVIPNSIQREIYVQETAKLMEISEGVLYSSLAQQIVSNRKQDGEQRIDEPVRMEVVQESQLQPEDLNELEKYEKEIIKTLLLFGNLKTEFIDWVEEPNAMGKLEIKKEIYENVVAQEIYLNLQDDEIEFTQDIFKNIYSILITQFNLNQNINIKHFTNHENPLIAQLASDIVLEEDKYVLSKWESRDIVVKPKETYISKQVTDIILNLRRVLIDEKIKAVMKSIKDKHPEREQIEEVLNYTRLRKLVFDKLHRVV
ncbi:MAG: DNA primase [Flavobacteriaceae bacterium]|nr:DNA primase [Flavobacteriaceae bacterium]